MANDRAQFIEFYSSTAWKKCREAYKKSKGGLCEKCLEQGLYTPGEIVHHKIHVSVETLQSPEVLLNPENLCLLCRDHHAAIHRKVARRWTIDELGRVTGLDG